MILDDLRYKLFFCDFPTFFKQRLVALFVSRTSYGRGFLYERALPPELKSKLYFWRPGDALPEPLTYLDHWRSREGDMVTLVTRKRTDC
jgi:hypothetical protein